MVGWNEGWMEAGAKVGKGEKTRINFFLEGGSRKKLKNPMDFSFFCFLGF
jgi:hypothetical protein